MIVRRGAPVLLPALLPAVLSACGGAPRPAAVAPAPAAAAAYPPAPHDWRRLATAADRERLRDWRAAWTGALGQARAGGAAASIAAQGALFAHDAALPDAVPPPGRYRCRVFKLGTPDGARYGSRHWTAYPWFACRVEAAAGGTARLTKLDGSQRHVGIVYRDGASRAAFLGTLLLGDEARAVPYGRDATRNLAGWLERVGAARWRLALPYPAFESMLDVMELVPAE